MRDTDDDDAVETAVTGAPLHWYDVAVPPFLLAVAAVGIPLIVMPRATPVGAVVVIAGGAVAFPAAVALGTFGFLAYRDLSAASIRRYQLAVCAALAALGMLLLLGPASVVALAAAGYRAAGLEYRWTERISTRAPSDVWRRRGVWTAVAALVVTVGMPLALGLGSPLLLIAVLILTIALPVLAGFSYRLGRWGRGG